MTRLPPLLAPGHDPAELSRLVRRLRSLPRGAAPTRRESNTHPAPSARLCRRGVGVSLSRFPPVPPRTRKEPRDVLAVGCWDGTLSFYGVNGQQARASGHWWSPWRQIHLSLHHETAKLSVAAALRSFLMKRITGRPRRGVVPLCNKGRCLTQPLYPPSLAPRPFPSRHRSRRTERRGQAARLRPVLRVLLCARGVPSHSRRGPEIVVDLRTHTRFVSL